MENQHHWHVVIVVVVAILSFASYPADSFIINRSYGIRGINSRELQMNANFFDNIFGTTSQQKPSGEVVDAVVIGSGISGSTAAYYLHSNGINTILAEARPEVGGNLISKSGR